MTTNIHLTKPKALAPLVNGQQQPLLQLLAVLVLGEVQLVEAGVGRRQAVRSTIRLVDLEPLRAGDALQSLEPFQRHLQGDQERSKLLSPNRLAILNSTRPK